MYTKWCAKTFPPIFELFTIFDCNFAEIVATPNEGNANCISLLKRYLVTYEKNLKMHQSRHINCYTIVAQTMFPSHEERSGLGA